MTALKKVLFICCLIFTLTSSGQTTFFQEASSVPFNHIEYVISTSDSGYALLTNYGNFLKMDKNGDTLWSEQFDISPNYPQHVFMLQTRDSGFLIMEETSYIAFGRMMIRTNKYGDTLWTLHDPTGYISNFKQQVLETSDGSLLITSQVGGGYHTPLSKIDNAGNPVWQKVYTINGNTGGVAIAEMSDGGYLVMGGLNSNMIFILKTDTSGNLLWSKIYQSSLANISASTAFIKENSSGEIVISAVTFLPGHTSSSTILLVTDSVGNIIWSKYYTGNKGLSIGYLSEKSDGGYLACGSISDTNLTNNFAPLFYKLNSSGNIESSTIVNDTGTNYYGLNRQTIDGGYITYFNSQNNSYISKIDSFGNNNCNSFSSPFSIQSDTFPVDTTPTYFVGSSGQISYLHLPVTIHQASFNINRCISNHTDDLDLLASVKIFPNPSSGDFKIETESSDIRFAKLYDLYGQIIFDSGIINAQHLKVECRNIHPGIYFLNVQLAHEMVTRKIIIK